MITKPHWFGELAVCIYGALLAFAFAPFNLTVFSILLPALLLISLLKTSPSRAFLRGWLFGSSFMAMGISWVYVSLHVHGQANIVLASSLTAALILLMGAFYGLLGYLLQRLFPLTTISKCLLGFPSLWVLLEWGRSWFLTGFPWLFIGYTQINSPLQGLAPIFSVYAVSWAVIFTSSLLVMIFRKESLTTTLFCLITLIILWLGSYLLGSINWTKPAAPWVTVSLIQGNIAQKIKWEASQADNSFNLYQSLTQQNLDSQIIIWPEAAITLSSEQLSTHLPELQQLLSTHNNTLVSGIPLLENNEYYNGMIVLGAGQGSYRKRHLVPFGEYMPLRSLFAWLDHYLLIPMSDMSKGNQNQPPMYIHGIPASGAICYEVAYPTLMVHNLPHSQVLVVISDDSWFGQSLAPAQHIQMAQMRALETGRYILMATNDAITAIINAKGKVVKFAPPFKEFVLTGQFQPMVGSTPLIVMGIYPCLSGLFILLIWGILRNRRKSSLKKGEKSKRL